jgi:hypothetical protein
VSLWRVETDRPVSERTWRAVAHALMNIGRVTASRPEGAARFRPQSRSRPITLTTGGTHE